MHFVIARFVCLNRCGGRPAVIQELINALAPPGNLITRCSNGIDGSRGCGLDRAVIQEIVNGIGSVLSGVIAKTADSKLICGPSYYRGYKSGRLPAIIEESILGRRGRLGEGWSKGRRW